MNKNFTLPRVLKTNLGGALLAALPGSSSGTAVAQTDARVRCSRLLVLNADRKRKYPSARLLTGLFTAENATRPANHVGKDFTCK